MPGVTTTGTKIFVGNLSSDVTSDAVRKLFEEYGDVTECDVLKNYGFVHMDTAENAEAAINELNGRDLSGQAMVVEASTGGRKDSAGSGKGIKRGGTKIFVGNLPIEATPDFIRKKFEEFGTVMECDILRNFGFVHMDTPENAQRSIKELHGSEVFGQKMTVEASTSDVRRNPGMGGADRCFRCGSSGHWSKICPDSSPGLRRRSSMRLGRDGRRAPYPLPRSRYDAYDRYDPYAYYEDRYALRRLPPPRRGMMPYSSRRSPPYSRSYPAYPTTRRAPAEYRREDPYGPPPAPARDYYAYPRDYPPAPAREYSPTYNRRYPSKDYSLSRYPTERQLPRAYGGTGRMSPVNMATRG